MNAESQDHDQNAALSGAILVVDDNEANRDVLARRLKRQGHCVTEATNGIEALALLEKQEFDAVLLDLLMPEMDGFEVLQRLRASERWRHLPVIVVSALGEVDAIARCIELGADDYLPKPFSPTLLKARLDACLLRKRVHDRERQLYEQLQSNFVRLQEAEKARDDLTHMIVHDLRSPLTATLAGIEMIGMMGKLNEAQQDCLDVALRSGKNLLGMINDLLDLSKMEAGGWQLNIEPLDAAAVASEVLQHYMPLVEGKHLLMRCEIAPDLPAVLADEDKLRRILFNLLSNAIKFTAQDGEIVLAVRREKDTLVFQVRDTGEGMPPEALEKIFEKFSQVESRQAGRKMSTGLGLTFCKMAVEAQGGRIWAESKIGQGSTFFFTLPCAP